MSGLIAGLGASGYSQNALQARHPMACRNPAASSGLSGPGRLMDEFEDQRRLDESHLDERCSSRIQRIAYVVHGRDRVGVWA